MRVFPSKICLGHPRGIGSTLETAQLNLSLRYTYIHVTNPLCITYIHDTIERFHWLFCPSEEFPGWISWSYIQTLSLICHCQNITVSDYGCQIYPCSQTFCSSVSIDNNSRKQKGGKNGEGLGEFIM